MLSSRVVLLRTIQAPIYNTTHSILQARGPLVLCQNFASEVHKNYKRKDTKPPHSRNSNNLNHGSTSRNTQRQEPKPEHTKPSPKADTVKHVDQWPHRIAAPNTSIRSFRDLGIAESICTVLDSMGITAPTPVQTAYIHHIMKGEDLIIRSHTGSGKTLGILVAILHNMRKTPNKAVHTLIIVPTRELGWQITRWIIQLKQLSDEDSSKYVLLAVAGVDLAKQAEQLKSATPLIVVATSKRLAELVEQGAVDFKTIKTLVIEEVDHIMQSLGSRASEKQVKNRKNHPKTGTVLIDEIKKLASDAQQTIVASATINHNTKRELQYHKWVRQYGTLFVDIGTPFTAPPTIKHYQISFEGENEDAEMDHALLQAIGALNVKSGLIFIESSGNVTELVTRLKEAGQSVAGLSGIMDFTSPSSLHDGLDAFMTGKVPLLVATEFTARGLDLPQVDTVFILGSFFSANSYLHMAGRTARMGRDGNVVVIFPSYKLIKVSSVLKFINVPIDVQTAIQAENTENKT